ncbi:MAG: Gfo/Idh/MocA family oxidoreductase [Thermoflexales bacterium]|nr:Gfo/Idh/MocA family oxidoreductase [Thermoflexales bacterium]MDW8350871.1 Gfo/Idh/MocA family oxidoreductase [Anaerolineae bacterium]
MTQPISIGIVGLGQFGVHFVELFQKHPLVKRVALCDIAPDRLRRAAQRFGIGETYASLDEICKSDLDALAIFTQPWLHAPQAIQAMEAGKHVYTAVPVIMPLSGNGDEILEWCDRLIACCRRTGQHYMMGETTYYRPETVMCRKRAAEFGRFIHLEAEYLHDTWLPACNLIEVQMARTGLSEAEVIRMGGDAPMHYPTHSTSAPISIMGAHAVEVAAFGYVYPDDPYFRADSQTGNTFSHEVGMFRMSNGALAVITESRRNGHTGHEGIVRIIGSEASYARDTSDEHSGLWFTKTGAQPVDPRTYRDPLPKALMDDLGGHGGSHAYLVHEFVSACAEGRSPAINAWEAVRYMAAGVMAHKSALRGGELLKVPDWGDAPGASR